MPAEFDPTVPGGQLAPDLLALVLGGVIEDEDADLHPLLGQHALHAPAEEAPVVIAGHENVHAAHHRPSASWRCRHAVWQEHNTAWPDDGNSVSPTSSGCASSGEGSPSSQEAEGRTRPRVRAQG